METLRHFKFNYDQLIEPQIPDICNELFGLRKCLVVAEKPSSNYHFHVQGYTPLSKDYFDRKVTQLITHKHFLHGLGKRPVRHARDPEKVTELGFQYMLKEPWDNVVYQQGFEEDEIVNLRAESAKYYDNVKNSLKRKWDEVNEPSNAKDYYTALCDAALDYFGELEKPPPPNTDRRALAYMDRKDKKYRPLVRDRLFKSW